MCGVERDYISLGSCMDIKTSLKMLVLHSSATIGAQKIICAMKVIKLGRSSTIFHLFG